MKGLLVDSGTFLLLDFKTSTILEFNKSDTGFGESLNLSPTAF